MGPAASRTAAFSESDFQMGTITAWTGASRGGSLRPESSPWTIMAAPTRRVETPQLVCWTNCCSLFSSRKRVLKTFAKLAPR